MRNTRRLMLALLMGVCLAIVGCEDGDDDSGSAPDSIAGTWNMTASGEGAGNHVITLYLSQSGITVSGPAYDVTENASGTVTGTYSAGSVSLTITMPWGTGTASGTASGNQMGGTWLGGGMQGTWSATRQ